MAIQLFTEHKAWHMADKLSHDGTLSQNFGMTLFGDSNLRGHFFSWHLIQKCHSYSSPRGEISRGSSLTHSDVQNDMNQHAWWQPRCISIPFHISCHIHECWKNKKHHGQMTAIPTHWVRNNWGDINLLNSNEEGSCRKMVTAIFLCQLHKQWKTIAPSICSFVNLVIDYPGKYTTNLSSSLARYRERNLDHISN